MSDREARRHAELSTMTIAQVAARGDRLKVKCLDCDRSKTFPAKNFVAQHGHKIVGSLRPRCDDCFRRRRRGVGLHSPGYATFITIEWPDDRP
jgi:hypothetical protein